MDLWIRTNKGNHTTIPNQLIKTDKLYIVKCERLEKTPYIITNGDFDFGCYKTEERALEILDEIQSLLMPHYEELYDKIKLKANTNKIPEKSNVMAIMQSSGDIQIQEFSNVVYEMPLE